LIKENSIGRMVPKTIQHPASWLAGPEAAHRGEPYILPKNVEHHQSFSLGYIEGQPAPDRIQARGELKPFLACSDEMASGLAPAAMRGCLIRCVAAGPRVENADEHLLIPIKITFDH